MAVRAAAAALSDGDGDGSSLEAASATWRAWVGSLDLEDCDSDSKTSFMRWRTLSRQVSKKARAADCNLWNSREERLE